MTSLDDLLAPITAQQFRETWLGRRPLHIPAAASDHKRALLDWSSFNRLLNQSDLWTAHTLRLMVNRVSVPAAEYCMAAQTPAGQVLRPVPGKVDVFLAEGASLVANEVQALHPPIDMAATALSRAFAARAGVNVYCSFKDVQAFGPHYDNHDVFAVQTEGEKIWRIYQTKIDMPVDLPPNTPETLEWLERAHGPLLTEVHMRPGDVLYLPRGQFHDALAIDGASLHVTFSVTALYGRVLFSLLDNVAMQFPAFRAYFPPAEEADGKALTAHLAELATLLRDIVASSAFRDEVAMSQERLVRRPAAFALPDRRILTQYRPTGRPFPPSGTALQVAWDWCAARARFSIEEMLGEFDFIAEERLRAAIEAAVAASALERLP